MRKGNGNASMHGVEVVKVSDLRPHERNYRAHPEDQLDHIAHSIEENGFYRNVVVAKDGTILAGHGVVEAAKRLEMDEIPVIRLDVAANDPQAIRILTGDNEISVLAEVDDRLLSELLRELRQSSDDGLLGTGYDDKMLANLVMVTRSVDEIADFDAAAAWAGLPEFEGAERPVQLIVSFDNNDDRDELLKLVGIDRENDTNLAASFGERTAWSIWWPPRQQHDGNSVRFVAGDSTEAE